MPVLQRRISIRGPRFFKDGDKLMFVNHLDGSTQIGPRPANAEDKRNHPDALAACQRGDAGEPFRPLVSFSTPLDVKDA